jgi:hypothetical protein
MEVPCWDENRPLLEIRAEEDIGDSAKVLHTFPKLAELPVRGV